MGAGQEIIAIQDLSTHFFTRAGTIRAVDGISLRINKGEFVSLVGESGSGKSTVGRSILRLVPFPGRIVGGKIDYKGRNLLRLTETEMKTVRGKEISMVFQDPASSLDPSFKIGEQLQETIMFSQHLSKSAARARAIELLSLVGIPSPEERLGNYPHQLSGGMKQRVMIALALSCNPSLLIADEPTTNLDVTVQAQILELMKKLQTEFDTSLLLMTHNLGIVAGYSDKVAVMYAGEVVEFATTKDLFHKPRHPYTQALLASLPNKDIEMISGIPGSVPDLAHPPTGCRFHPRCPFAMKICTESSPKEVEIDAGHLAACYLYNQ